MADVFERIFVLVQKGEVKVSEHGYDELANDQLTAREIISGLAQAMVVEEYPNFPKGPCVLVLQRDQAGDAVHVVWGIPKGYNSPAVLVTAYRPDPDKWDESFLRRK